MTSKKPDLVALLLKLGHSSEVERAKAAASIGKYGRSALLAVPSLILTLSDEGRVVRDAAANALFALDRDGVDVAMHLRKVVQQVQDPKKPRPIKAAWVLERLEHERSHYWRGKS